MWSNVGNKTDDAMSLALVPVEVRVVNDEAQAPAAARLERRDRTASVRCCQRQPSRELHFPRRTTSGEFACVENIQIDVQPPVRRV